MARAGRRWPRSPRGSHGHVRGATWQTGACNGRAHGYSGVLVREGALTDVLFSCVVKTQRRWSNKIYKTELTKTRYNNQVLGKYRVDPRRAGLTLIAELTWSNLGLKGVLNKRK